jgi:hypothetical protein
LSPSSDKSGGEFYCVSRDEDRFTGKTRNNRLAKLSELIVGWYKWCYGYGCVSAISIIIYDTLLGPLSNAPLDTIKTRIQKMSNKEAEGNGWQRFRTVVNQIIKNEGYLAFYKGLTPRILRVAPGQAVTFMVYERVRRWLEKLKAPEEVTKDIYEEN